MDFHGFVECESGRDLGYFPNPSIIYHSSSRKANSSWLKMSLLLLHVQSPGHFLGRGRQPSSLKSPHFTSGRHDASTWLLQPECLAFNKLTPGWCYYTLQGNLQVGWNKHTLLALSYCLITAHLNEIWRSHAYVNCALNFFFSFPLSPCPYLSPFPLFILLSHLFFFLIALCIREVFTNSFSFPQYYYLRHHILSQRETA